MSRPHDVAAVLLMLPLCFSQVADDVAADLAFLVKSARSI